jgi:hypothetical protein
MATTVPVRIELAAEVVPLGEGQHARMGIDRLQLLATFEDGHTEKFEVIGTKGIFASEEIGDKLIKFGKAIKRGGQYRHRPLDYRTALEGLIDAVTKDANEKGGKGISGFTSARRK